MIFRNAGPVSVVFRADASFEIGTGHVMRCLALAEALEARGKRCSFISRSHEGHLNDVIAGKGFTVHELPDECASDRRRNNVDDYASWLGTDWFSDAKQSRTVLEDLRPEWLVVDHYALGAEWERCVRPRGTRVAVIDDLANRSHACDLLLDQNLGRCVEDYSGQVPESCRLLIGPNYALLRPEFAQARPDSLRRRVPPKLQRILITMGGVDKDNSTGRVLDVLKSGPIPSNCSISVIMGAEALWLDSVKAQAAVLPRDVEIEVGVGDMARKMADADLAIGAAGSTSWERCCLGLPTVLLALADNQIAVAKHLDDQGAALYLGKFGRAGWPERLKAVLSAIIADVRCLGDISRAASLLVDGRGALRVVDAMEVA